MVVGENQIFNLMDTNGRRSDVLNALKVYLEILEELGDEYPTETWNRYPASVAQFLFYERALDKSREVFKVHRNYDQFLTDLGEDYEAFLRKDPDWIVQNLPHMSRMLDEAIEKRSRHYTSNLVKIGFADPGRNITQAGYAYLRGALQPDAVETILPLDKVNLALLRQLLKLRVFSNPLPDGTRRYYAPFFMALSLLMGAPSLDRQTFEIVIQGLSPYSSEEIKQAVRSGVSPSDLEKMIGRREIKIPEEFMKEETVSLDRFQQYFKSSKQNDSIVRKYYGFYTALKDFREDPTPAHYQQLLTCLEADAELLQKAFGRGKAVFQIGNRGNRYDLDTFRSKNARHPLLTTAHYNREIYAIFSASKWIDGIREYSDTTIRLLSATGLFKFEPLPELAFGEILALIFDAETLRQNVFGQMSEEEYLRYEASGDCYFGKSHSMLEILHYSAQHSDQVLESIQQLLGVQSSGAARALLLSGKSKDFHTYIRNKYPKERIMTLLPLFSDRANDDKIKREVNDAATVPTIYEYIVGIAWFYLSGEDFDLYSSLKLTLNADFEPVVHAGGGDGDIVIQYDDMAVMLEVPLMNKQAQKRGEWEPVLRHSLNLKAANESKETFTFFIADELDGNTINIWRAVAAVPLESTNTHKPVSGVVIMPFTNREVLSFLQKGVCQTQIIEATKDSFQKVPPITDVKWHQDIASALLS